jgi:hypothetical protein
LIGLSQQSTAVVMAGAMAAVVAFLENYSPSAAMFSIRDVNIHPIACGITIGLLQVYLVHFPCIAITNHSSVLYAFGSVAPYVFGGEKPRVVVVVRDAGSELCGRLVRVCPLPQEV